VISHFVARRFQPDSLYSGWLHRRGEHLEHGTDLSVLRSLRVRDAFEPTMVTFGPDWSVAAMLNQQGQSSQTAFPVVDAGGVLLGVVTAGQLSEVARNPSLDPILIAADLAGPTDTETPTDALFEATRRMGVRGTSSLPVIEPGTERLLGTVTMGHILSRDHRELNRAG
jgi:CIC family chloride channel protein